MRMQVSQLLIVLFLMSISTPPTSAQQFRFGLNGQPSTEGLQITQLSPDSAMRNLVSASVQGFTASAEVGDVITAINGRPIRTVNDLLAMQQQLAMNNGACVMSIRCTSTGQMHDFRVTAKRVGNIPNPGTPPGATPQPNGLRRVHFLVCGQTATNKSSFNRSIQANMGMLRALIDEVDARYRCCATYLTGAECNRSSMTQRLDAMQAGPDDTIFFYYSGHGAHDAGGNHFFQLGGNAAGGGDMYRSEISSRLARKNVRLKLLITESCNVESQFVRGMAMAGAGVVSRGLSNFESLLLEHRGFLDVNSAAPGQYGWGGPSGGIFTNVFTSTANFERDWFRLFQSVSDNASSTYQDSRKQAMSNGKAPQEMQNQMDMRPHFYRRELAAAPYSVSLPATTTSGP